MPQDGEPFTPGPGFYSAIDLAVSDDDLDVRYHAAEQVLLCLQGAALKSEAAFDVLELVLQIRSERSVSENAVLTRDADCTFPLVESGEQDIFGDNGVLAATLGQIVSLNEVSARRWAFATLAVQVVNEMAEVEEHIVALSQFVAEAARRERKVVLH